MFRAVSFIALTGFWITMMSLLAEREFFRLTPVQTPYEVLTLEKDSLRQEYQAIYLGTRRIGFAFSVLEKLDPPDTDFFEFRHQSYLTFLLLGRENEMLIKGKARLNAQFYLEAFEVRVSSKDDWTRFQGKITPGAAEILTESKSGRKDRRVIPLTGPIYYSEALDFIWTPENLKVGKQGGILIWNPVLGMIQPVSFKVERKETIAYEKKSTETFVVAVESGGVQTHHWISPEGVTLRKESPLGLIFQKEPANEIFDALRLERSSPVDLPNLFSIPSNRILENPEALTFLKAKVTSPEGEKVVERRRENPEKFATVSRPFADPTGTLKPFLEPSERIESADAEIKKKALEIVGGETSALRASFRLMRWVYNEMTPDQTSRLPSAKQALMDKKGDCKEYTALFTALARAGGIPAKMVAGLVYRNGRFFYHAWPEVYLGEWVGMDPTFNQAPTDVTHIPLVEDDLVSITSLVNKIGKIKIEILEAK